MQWQRSLKKKKTKITEKQKAFIENAPAQFPQNNNYASPKEVGFWREKNKRETHWSQSTEFFPLWYMKKMGLEVI